MILGSPLFAQLATRLTEEDPGSSAHWQHEHADFVFTGEGFENLHGFGGTERARSFMRNSLHWLLMHPFRRMGRGFPTFLKVLKTGNAMAKAQDRDFNLDMLRQCLSLAFLQSNLPPGFPSAPNICIIGDGFGTLSSLYISAGHAKKVILVNLTKTLLVDLWYLRLWLSQETFDQRVVLADTPEGVLQAQTDPEIYVIAIEARNNDLLTKAQIDLAINIASMQEMNPDVISQYFTCLRESRANHSGQLYFYCCNREEKTLNDGTMVRYTEYPWRASDNILIDALCPWHQKFYRMGFPIYQPYDGPVCHRLVELSA